MVWHALVDALMRPRAIEIPHVLLEDMSQVPFAHEQDVIEAFTTNAAQQSFADGVRAWCPYRRPEHLDPAPDRNSLKVVTVLGIVVANEILRPSAERRCLPQLLSDPVVGW